MNQSFTEQGLVYSVSIHPSLAKLIFHPREVLSHYRDPQRQVGEHDSHLVI